MNQPVAFIMDRLPLQKGPTIRIVFPGLDHGNAVVFESMFPGYYTKDQLEALLDLVVKELPKVKKSS